MSEGLETATAAMDHRISSIENHVPNDRPTSHEVQAKMLGPARQEKTGLLDTPTTSTLPRTPQWTSVVKKGQKKTAPQNAAVQPRFKQAHPKRELKNVEITGIGTEGKIQVITTKLVSVFATKFAPSLEADTLYNYLIEKLGNETVTCCRMESAHCRFSSFQITSECVNICYVQPATLACWNIYTPVL